MKKLNKNIITVVVIFALVLSIGGVLSNSQARAGEGQGCKHGKDESWY